MKNIKIIRTVQLKGYQTQKQEIIHKGIDKEEASFYMDCVTEAAVSFGAKQTEKEENYIEFETDLSFISYEYTEM